MRNFILIVDDIDINRSILREVFMENFEILEAVNGEDAIAVIREYKDKLAAVLLDIIMPVLDGFGVLEYMKRRRILGKVPVLLISSETASVVKERGYEYGVSDFISKPFDSNVVERRVNNIIDLYYHKNELEQRVKEQTKLIREQDEKLNEVNENIINALGTIVEFRNLNTGSHVLRLKAFTRILLEYIQKNHPEYKLSKEDINAMVYATAMHDVGKIFVSDAILLKPGKLTEEEFETVKEHTTKGSEILKEFSSIDDPVYLKHCCDISLSHHERYDGKGYPEGLVGDMIPISAQAVSLADVYDALVSKRVYKDAYSKDEAFRMILEGECGVFNPKLIMGLIAERRRFEERADIL